MTREESLKTAKPILFNAEMVRAIQNGRKTVTRRVVKHQPERNNDIIYKHPECEKWFISPDDDNVPETEIKPTYKVGDILYVRETWARYSICIGVMPTIYYKADGITPDNIKWIPSIYMPKEAARIFLRVTDVRVERLQDITEKQAIAEGIRIGMGGEPYFSCRDAYAPLWNSAVKRADRDKYGWAANPWVWVIEFEKLEVTK